MPEKHRRGRPRVGAAPRRARSPNGSAGSHRPPSTSPRPAAGCSSTTTPRRRHTSRVGTLELAELQAGEDEELGRQQRALASLIVAVIDGLSLQVTADPDSVDQDLVFGLLADMVRLWLRGAPGG